MDNKNYRWSPEDKIEITGLEYDILQKSIGIFEGAAVFEPAAKVRAAILSRMIEQNIAVEFVDDSQQEPETEMNTVDPTAE
jgi:hypothetical protein